MVNLDKYIVFSSNIIYLVYSVCVKFSMDMVDILVVRFWGLKSMKIRSFKDRLKRRKKKIKKCVFA